MRLVKATLQVLAAVRLPTVLTVYATERRVVLVVINSHCAQAAQRNADGLANARKATASDGAGLSWPRSCMVRLSWETAGCLFFALVPMPLDLPTPV